jgi:hypothetical protein
MKYNLHRTCIKIPLIQNKNNLGASEKAFREFPLILFQHHHELTWIWRNVVKLKHLFFKATKCIKHCPALMYWQYYWILLSFRLSRFLQTFYVHRVPCDEYYLPNQIKFIFLASVTSFGCAYQRQKMSLVKTINSNGLFLTSASKLLSQQRSKLPTKILTTSYTIQRLHEAFYNNNISKCLFFVESKIFINSYFRSFIWT